MGKRSRSGIDETTQESDHAILKSTKLGNDFEVSVSGIDSHRSKSRRGHDNNNDEAHQDVGSSSSFHFDKSNLQTIEDFVKCIDLIIVKLDHTSLVLPLCGTYVIERAKEGAIASVLDLLVRAADTFTDRNSAGLSLGNATKLVDLLRKSAASSRKKTIRDCIEPLTNIKHKSYPLELQSFSQYQNHLVRLSQDDPIYAHTSLSERINIIVDRVRNQTNLLGMLIQVVQLLEQKFSPVTDVDDEENEVTDDLQEQNPNNDGGDGFNHSENVGQQEADQ